MSPDMNLYLIRHGIAVPQDSPGIHSDQERPLSPKGIKRMRKAAKGLLTLDIAFDRVFTSPLLRARQTAQIVAEILEIKEQPEELPDLAPGGSVEGLLSSLSAHREKKRLILVGHQPLLGEIASLLLAKDKGIEISLKKGGLCRIESDDLPSTGGARLHWILTPRQLRLLAG
jgi:phosphohistidine phosphatase